MTRETLNTYSSNWPEVKIFFILALFLTKCKCKCKLNLHINVIIYSLFLLLLSYTDELLPPGTEITVNCVTMHLFARIIKDSDVTFHMYYIIFYWQISRHLYRYYFSLSFMGHF
jgi:hypothetical protein